MMALVTGGAASGKSAYAERLAISLPGPHAYVATMRHGDAETEARISRHRRMREGKGFLTFELADAGQPELSASLFLADPRPRDRSRFRGCRTALLEDLGNLVANRLEGKLEDVLACENVVVVANEVGCDGIQYDPFTMEYVEKLGALACELGARADVVVEVVAGVPDVVKGEVPWDC